MVGLLIALISVGGGLSIGVVLVLGSFIHRVGLPGSPQRRVAQARVAAEIAKHDSFAAERRREIAEAEFKRSQIEHNRLLMEAQSMNKLEQVQSLEFQAQLVAPPRRSS